MESYNCGSCKKNTLVKRVKVCVLLCEGSDDIVEYYTATCPKCHSMSTIKPKEDTVKFSLIADNLNCFERVQYI